MFLTAEPSLLPQVLPFGEAQFPVLLFVIAEANIAEAEILELDLRSV